MGDLNQSVELVDPDEYSGGRGAITMLRVHFNESQSTAVNLTKEDLRSIVQQAADKYGVFGKP